MTISMIVAVAKNGVIGNKGELAWYLPAELARFKQTTMGHPIIMGRKTHESIGRALPGRQNIVITRNNHYEAPGCTVVHSLDEALQAAKGADEVFIIGGATIYDQAMPRTDRLYLTQIDGEPEGDTLFHYNPSDWQEKSREPHPTDDKNPYAYTFLLLERKY